LFHICIGQVQFLNKDKIIYGTHTTIETCLKLWYNVLIMFSSDKTHGRLRPPLYASTVAAGFPSPADDYMEGALDLNEYLIAHPAATFMVRVEGASMTGAGILSGDLLIVDRSVESRSGHIVIAVISGELTVKRLIKGSHGWLLKAEHPDYPPTKIGPDAECSIWGVVTGSVRRFVS
jgi:DNA polymerase V